MKRFGLVIMIFGVLSTLSSTFFRIVNNQHNIIPLFSFWALLTAFELFFAWVLLASQTRIPQRSRNLVFVTLVTLTFAWIMFAFMDTDRKSIFIFALNTLYFSGLYFTGLIIYCREKKM